MFSVLLRFDSGLFCNLSAGSVFTQIVFALVRRDEQTPLFSLQFRSKFHPFTHGPTSNLYCMVSRQCEWINSEQSLLWNNINMYRVPAKDYGRVKFIVCVGLFIFSISLSRTDIPPWTIMLFPSYVYKCYSVYICRPHLHRSAASRLYLP